VKKRSRRASVVAGVAIALVLAACGGAEEEPAAPAPAPAPEEQPEEQPEEVDPFAEAREFYEGEELTFIVSYSEGGGYDRMSRAMAPLLEEYLGATVFVENRPGAGGLVAANSLWNGDTEGREFGSFAGQGTVASVLAEAEGVGFDIEDWNYIARFAAEPRMLTIGSCQPLETFEDVLAMSDFTFASTGPGGADHIDQAVLFEVFPLNGRTVAGYSGSAETRLAVTSCDAVGGSGTVSSREQELADGDHRAVLIIGRERLEDLPDVPTILDFDLTDEQRAVAEAHIGMAELGRIILAPPGVPEDRVEYLRAAFESVINDPRLDEARDPFGPYLSGPDLADLVTGILGAPQAYVDVLTAD